MIEDIFKSATSSAAAADFKTAKLKRKILNTGLPFLVFYSTC